MKPLEVIGLDVGKARTGIARGSTAAKLAEPLTTVKTDDILTKLNELVAKNEVGAIVVGLPRNLDGRDTSQTAWTRDWVKDAKTRFNIPIYWQDEALSTKMAEAGRRNGKHTELDADAIAASVILQDFLDTPESERVPA